MQHATTLTVIRHDDSAEQYTDVRYTLTRAGLRILTAPDTVVHVDANDFLTTHATVDRAGQGRR